MAQSRLSDLQGYGRRSRPVLPLGNTPVPTDFGVAMAWGMERSRGGKRRPTSVDEDVISSQLEEAGDILKHKREGVRLPVISVVGEFDGALDIYWFSS